MVLREAVRKACLNGCTVQLAGDQIEKHPTLVKMLKFLEKLRDINFARIKYLAGGFSLTCIGLIISALLCPTGLMNVAIGLLISTIPTAAGIALSSIVENKKREFLRLEEPTTTWSDAEKHSAQLGRECQNILTFAWVKPSAYTTAGYLGYHTKPAEKLLPIDINVTAENSNQVPSCRLG